MNYQLLKSLCECFGPSGYEEKVREFIIEQIKDNVDEYYTDHIGNLIAHKKGNGKKVMIAAHMDQIGLMVTDITKEGYIKFTNLGYLAPEQTICQRVRFENGRVGVIGVEHKENRKGLKISDLYVDVYAKDKEDALKNFKVGDVAVYTHPAEILEEHIMAPALDDRYGVFIAIETIKAIKNNDNDMYFVFTVQEEVGLRGAKTAAFNIQADYGIALDVTISGDELGDKHVPMKMGNGVAIKVKDSSLLVNPIVKNWMIDTAKDKNICYQLEILEAGGTDGGAMQLTGRGALSGVLSVPIRYVHSASEIAAKKDIEASFDLLLALLEKPINL